MNATEFLATLNAEQLAEIARANVIWNERYEPYGFTCCVCLKWVDRRDGPHSCVCECERPTP